MPKWKVRCATVVSVVAVRITLSVVRGVDEIGKTCTGTKPD